MTLLPLTVSAPPFALQSKRYVVAIAVISAFGGFLFGYDLGLIGAANSYLRDQFHLSPAALGFASASAALGCLIGPFLGGWLCDRVGRERTMMVAAALLGVGAALTAFAPTITWFNVFRIVGGVGVGLCSIACPMYIAEVAPPKVRGRLGIMYQVAIVVGSTMAPLVAYFLVRGFPDSVSWRWMFGSQMLFVLAFASFLFGLPPSPRWLASRGRQQEAMEVLVRVHGVKEAESEFREIDAALAAEPGGLAELWRPGLRYALIVGLLLAFFAQWTGWSAMGGYIPMLLEMSGVHDRRSAILQFAMTYVTMAVLAVVAMFLVDRIGRKPLWIGGSVAMAAFTFYTGILFYNHHQGVAVLLAIMLCALPHGLALGPLPWLMMSEIFPNRIRAKAVALTTTFLWLAIFACAQLFPVLMAFSQRTLGSIAGIFWLFSGICVLATLYGVKMLPETGGRTLEDIGRSLGKKKDRR
jgi:SP family arabinose:H+ symporter-like MFS transporter